MIGVGHVVVNFHPVLLNDVCKVALAAVNNALLKSLIGLGESSGGRVCAHVLEHVNVNGCVGNADLHALEVVKSLDGRLDAEHVTEAGVNVAENVQAGAVCDLVKLGADEVCGDFLCSVNVAVLEGQAEYCKLGLVCNGCPNGAFGEAHVACAGDALLCDVLLVAELLVCEDLDLACAVGLFFNELLDLCHLLVLDGVLGVDVADGQGVLRVGGIAVLIGVALAAALAASGQRTQGQNHCQGK